MKLNQSKFKIYTLVVLCSITILLFQILSNTVVSPALAAKEYIPEHIRARLPEVRECVKEDPGNSWKNCRANCDDICNEILEPYERGVCNGALIQLCCYEQPSGCK